MSVFGSGVSGLGPKPVHDRTVRMRLMVTVLGAPQPSARYGTTVCLAGLRVDTPAPAWVRLYPLSVQHLANEKPFQKYDVIAVDAKPSRSDQRRESWKLITGRVEIVRRLRTWPSRRTLLDPFVEDSMCRLNREARARPDAQSLALVRPRRIHGITITSRGGWNREQQRRIDAYASRPDLFGDRSGPLPQPPRFKATYRYLCHDKECKGHRQEITDGDFVALQRRLAGHSDAALGEALKAHFLDTMCAPDRDVAFYVGNQGKRLRAFSVLGVYSPTR